MTHHTDADLMHCPFCGGEAEAKKPDPSYEFTLIKCQECDAQTDERIDFVDAAEAWNRRAPAAPVPQGWKPVPVELLERIQESLGSFVSDQGWSQSDMDTADALDGLLDAAPQPPEAAPVPKALTDAQITIACLSYRHDFGLMHASERKSLIFQAREWERALNKARGAA